MQEIQTQGRMKQKMTKVFVSYHFTTKDLKFNGFGNWVGEFETGSYSKDDMDKFIISLEETISRVLKKGLGKECQVKVLFYR